MDKTLICFVLVSRRRKLSAHPHKLRDQMAGLKSMPPISTALPVETSCETVSGGQAALRPWHLSFDDLRKLDAQPIINSGGSNSHGQLGQALNHQ